MAVKTRTNSAGFLEGFDEATGQLVWTEKRKSAPKPGRRVASSPGQGRPSKELKETHHYVISGDGQKLWVPKGTDPSHLPRVAWPFNQVTADLISQKLTEGQTIKQIGSTEGFPPAHVIHGWSRKYPEFKRELCEAKAARAEFYADQVMEIAELTNKDTIMEDRLKTEIKKWRASVDDPGTYGARTKITGDASAPLTFVIDTGVRSVLPEPREEIELTEDPSS